MQTILKINVYCIEKKTTARDNYINIKFDIIAKSILVHH